MIRILVALTVVTLTLSQTLSGGEKRTEPRSGAVTFTPAETESTLPEQFRLARRTFEFRQAFVETSSDVMELSTVTFPSPVVTPHELNNTVHCEYFRPLVAGPRPGVIVLHILGGDFELSRLFARNLAARGLALVDAFPWNTGPGDTKATDHYHGSLSMFTAAGFVPLATHENVTVVRKMLK